jgi:ATP-dependent DNA helicase RecG
LEGHAFELLREADSFIRRHLPVAGRIQPGIFDREDQPIFPPLALREGLVNAFCHRDYSIPGGAVSVGIFDDRLEITSTGALPPGITVEDLKREHTSRPRNPLLAEVFYRRGLIERWGRGTQKIVELCQAAGHPEPEFEERAGEVVVRFLPSGYIAPHRVSHDLTSRQREVLQILADGRKYKFREVYEGLENRPAERTLRDDMKMLRDLGLIECSGRGPNARWQLAPRR